VPTGGTGALSTSSTARGGFWKVCADAFANEASTQQSATSAARGRG
jgi:hypothetical protein